MSEITINIPPAEAFAWAAAFAAFGWTLFQQYLHQQHRKFIKHMCDTLISGGHEKVASDLQKHSKECRECQKKTEKKKETGSSKLSGQ